MANGEEGTTTTRPRGQSAIIKRPRLTTLLDESEARIILLVAPAGYGKTTLAREWLEGKEGVVWYSGRPAMADVAALAVDMAAALESDPKARAAATERIEILAAKGQRPAYLARAVGAGIPQTCTTLVIDDYHYASSPESEAFLADLLLTMEERVVITSRAKPAWIEPRLRIYGDVLTIGAANLALTEDEARDVLGADPQTEDVLEKAQGWPALIGLAARGGEHLDAEIPTDDLYEFFAEDLFRRAPADLQRALMLLALADDPSSDAYGELLGDSAEESLSTATEHGFLSTAAGDQRIHPLLRRFLNGKVRELPASEADALVRRVVDVLVARQRWSDCLAALRVVPQPGLVSSTLASALPDLLDSGRIATVKEWIELAHAIGLSDGNTLVAEAEIALRNRDDAGAQALAERAGALLRVGDGAARAYTVAARAAHLREDVRGVTRNVDLALGLSASDDIRATALWIAFLSALDHSPSDAANKLERLQAIPDQRPSHTIRLATAIQLEMVSAGGDLYTVADGLHAARGLIKHARDPFTTTNLLNISTHIAVLLARYGQALDLAGELLAEASASGLDFAADHALVDRLAALVGQRKLSAAQATLNTLQEYADRSSPVVEWSTYLQAIRLRTALGDLARASSLLEREAPKSLPMVTLGEYLAQRGLVATALGDYRAAETAFDGARKCRGVSNTAFLCRLGDAALRLRRTDGESSQTCVAALLAAFECGHLDAVVTAVRAVPELICAGASDPRCARALTQILHASCDIDLGRRAGLVMARELRPRERLSPRERDVYELVVQGRTNKQIANTLFISESTTKVHVRHIFEKLGVRTRAEAARFRMPEDVV